MINGGEILVKRQGEPTNRVLLLIVVYGWKGEGKEDCQNANTRPIKF